MEIPIESLSFSEREQKYYLIEFEILTISQSLPIQDRTLNLSQISKLFKQLKVNDENIKRIWQLISENRDLLRFPHFMAAMRLCSALKQGKLISSDTFRVEQQVLARKRPNPPQKLAKVEEVKKTEEKLSQIVQTPEERPKEKDLIADGKKDLTGISLQVSQEIKIENKQKFEDVDLGSDDGNNINTNGNRFGPLPQVCERNEKESLDRAGVGEMGGRGEVDQSMNENGKKGVDKDCLGDGGRKEEFKDVGLEKIRLDGFNDMEDCENRWRKSSGGTDHGIVGLGDVREGKAGADGGFLRIDGDFPDPKANPASFQPSSKQPLPPPSQSPFINPDPVNPSIPSSHLQSSPISSASPLDLSEVKSEINFNNPSKSFPVSQKPNADPKPQEKILNLPAVQSSPTKLEAKVEELKKSPKLVPRAPSMPKIYKGQLKQIPEEVTPPRSSSTRETSISVESPVLITSGWWGASSYYVYSISTRVSGKSFTVKRRFSDLDWMHNQLLAKYKGFIIPSLPEKKVLGKNEEKFVEERRASMEKYLNIIAKHPILCSSFAFKTFTQTANEKFDREKLDAEGVEEYSEYKNIEDAMDQVCALFQNKLQLILSQKVLPLSDEINYIEEKIARLEVPVQTFNGSLSQWVKSRIDSEAILANLNISKEFSEKMQTFKSISRENSASLRRLALEAREDQIQLEGLKEALNVYKMTIEKCSKIQNLISRKLAKHKNSSNEDTKARYLSEIQSTQDTIDKYNKDLEEIEQNLLKESKSFELSKTEHLGLTIKEMILTQKSHYEKESSFWSQSLPSSN